MKPFLQQIATHFSQLNESKHLELEQTIFVFPSRRAGVFFQQYLAQHTTKPIFAPACYTINELFAQLAPQYEIEDRIGLLLRLYTCYKEVSNSNESFDSFVGFGEVLLKDFNDIDNYLVNPMALYSNLADLNQISDISYLTPEQLDALSTFLGYIQDTAKNKQAETGRNWKILGQLYQNFTQSLLSQHLAYDGLLHRIVCESESLHLPACNQIVFIGFNALDGATRKLFSRLKALNKADFYWDYQSDYLQDKANKAHYFAQQNVAQFPSNYPFDLEPLSAPAIHTIAIPSSIGQTKYVAQLLQGQSGQKHTALVLADEQLLVPMLYAIPNDKDHPVQAHTNITMGYPLQQTNIMNLISNYIGLHSTITEDGFYNPYVLSILQHPYLQETFHIDYTSQELAALIRHLYIKPDSLQSLFAQNEVLKNVFVPQASNQLLEALDTLITHISIAYDIEQELLQVTHQQLVRIQAILEENAQVYLLPNTLVHLIKQALSHQSYAFVGRPTKGLQVMGILETRCLDFEEVIITSFNEGIYPQKDNNNTYIPYNIRSHFGLPTTEHQDAIYAYNFYRLIQRAKQVYLLYDTRNDGNGATGEVSRFVQQLTFLYNHPIQRIQVNCSTDIATIQPIKITQDANTIAAKVEHFLNKQGLSPTALNTFINCPLQFYFTHIENIRIPDPISIDLNAKQFGNVFHYVMEHIYKPYERQEITIDLLKNICKNKQDQINILLQRGMVKEIHQVKTEHEIDTLMPSSTIKGILLLSMEVLKEFVLACLKQDMNNAPFYYLAGEKHFERFITNPALPYTIKLKGNIDRIESRNDGIHIIDYKTSKTKDKDQKFTLQTADLFDTASKISNRNELLQVYFYNLLTAPHYQQSIYCHLYHVRKMFSDPLLFQANSQYLLPDNWEEEFMQQLNKVIASMANVDTLLSQTEHESNCTYCTFKDLCGKV